MATFLKKKESNNEEQTGGAQQRAPKSKTREWVDAVVFAVVAATIILIVTRWVRQFKMQRL